MKKHELTTGWKSAEREAVEPDGLTVQVAKGVPMFFRRIRPGEFLMGERGGPYRNEEPRHRVQINQEFWLGTFPVTQKQFAVWTQASGEDHENQLSNRPQNPAENLYWWQALAYCRWLTKSGCLPKGWAATLPTEARWEYACRAGTRTEYYTGDGEAALAEAGWYEGNSEGETHPVGELARNPWGLYDMHGNVWEWCMDAWSEEAHRVWVDRIDDLILVPGSDGSPPDRVVRGGSWFNWPEDCRSAFRIGGRPAIRNWYRGFRVCLLPGPVVIEQEEAARTEAGAPERGGKPSGDRRERERPPRTGAPPEIEWDEWKGPSPGGRRPIVEDD